LLVLDAQDTRMVLACQLNFLSQQDLLKLEMEGFL